MKINVQDISNFYEKNKTNKCLVTLLLMIDGGRLEFWKLFLGPLKEVKCTQVTL